MTSPDIKTQVNDGCFEIRFNRSDKKNAITAEMYLAMADGVRQAEADDSVRVISIVGDEKSFCAGNDLKDFVENPPNEDQSPVWQFLSQISNAKKPVIAGVNGAAIGIGTTLLLHCDLVIASRTAVFAMPFTSLGLCPEAASSLLLPQMVGQKKTSEWLMLGSRFDADTAMFHGLINQVCETPDEVDLQLQEWKDSFNRLPFEAVIATKQLIKQPTAAAVTEHIKTEGKVFKHLLHTDEAQAAFNAFLKR